MNPPDSPDGYPPLPSEKDMSPPIACHKCKSSVQQVGSGRQKCGLHRLVFRQYQCINAKCRTIWCVRREYEVAEETIKCR